MTDVMLRSEFYALPLFDENDPLISFETTHLSDEELIKITVEIIQSSFGVLFRLACEDKEFYKNHGITIRYEKDNEGPFGWKMTMDKVTLQD